MFRKREKELCESEHTKNSLVLEELIKERKEFERTAKGLSGSVSIKMSLYYFLLEKLEIVAAERKALQDEHEKNLVILDITFVKI